MSVELNKCFLPHKFIQFNPVLTGQETVSMMTEIILSSRKKNEKLKLNCSADTLKSLIQNLQQKYISDSSAILQITHNSTQ